jgi:hypothetical protein
LRQFFASVNKKLSLDCPRLNVHLMTIPAASGGELEDLLQGGLKLVRLSHEAEVGRMRAIDCVFVP